MNEINPSAVLGKILYKEVKRQVLAALAANEWKPSEAIPSENQLGERFGVSIGTLRKAIDELVAENILIRHQGRGTFVATHTGGQHLFRFFNVTTHDGEKNYPTLALVRFLKGKADKIACVKLGISGSTGTFQFTNMLSLDNEPVLLEEITVPEALFVGLTEAKLRKRPTTLYNLYESEFGLNVIRVEERLRATLASLAHAKLLGIKAGVPLLEIQRVAFSYNNQRVEWRVSYVNTERHEYVSSRD